MVPGSFFLEKHMANDIQRMPTISVRNAGATGARNMRNPIHNFHVRQRPFEIQPVAIAPVLAGDSLRMARWEARVMTDPVLNPITGWWSEWFLFYVRVGDLDEAAAARTFLTTDAEYPATTGLLTTDNTWTYFDGPGGVDWLAMAMKPIIRTYFRTEGQDWNVTDGMLGSIPIAAVPTKHWMDTLHAYSALPANITNEDYAGRWEAYEALRRQKLITVTFIEYLRSQGVDVPDQLNAEAEDFRRPELLRYHRAFAYPQNTVNPTSGAVAAAASWVVNERCDKRIYADEPGFLVLVHVCRPKVYRSNQNGTGLQLFRNGRAFHSGVQEDAPQETLITRETTTGTGPVSTTVDYAADTNGLLCLGDQFIRGTSFPSVALPTGTGLQSHYPATAAIDALFAAASPANTCWADGAITFGISGRRRLDVTLR